MKRKVAKVKTYLKSAWLLIALNLVLLTALGLMAKLAFFPSPPPHLDPARYPSPWSFASHVLSLDKNQTEPVSYPLEAAQVIAHFGVLKVVQEAATDQSAPSVRQAAAKLLEELSSDRDNAWCATTAGCVTHDTGCGFIDPLHDGFFHPLCLRGVLDVIEYLDQFDEANAYVQWRNFALLTAFHARFHGDEPVKVLPEDERERSEMEATGRTLLEIYRPLLHAAGLAGGSLPLPRQIQALPHYDDALRRCGDDYRSEAWRTALRTMRRSNYW